MEKSFLTRKYKQLPFALPSSMAHKAIADREQKMAVGLLGNASEPTAIKRRVVQKTEEPEFVKRAIE
jgi:hypothetical protein